MVTEGPADYRPPEGLTFRVAFWLGDDWSDSVGVKGVNDMATGMAQLEMI